MLKPLTREALCEKASEFARIESTVDEPSLYGVTDGKAVGTYLEHKFKAFLSRFYEYDLGSSSRGIDFPDLNIDMKVTSFKQPQSSCPFKSASQKIYGLGYSLLIFVYDKEDNDAADTGRLNVMHTVLVDAARTADFQTTNGLKTLLDHNAGVDDLVGFFEDRRLPLDEIEAKRLAQQVLDRPPKVGYLTISNALQWRLQYRRAIEEAGDVDGIKNLAEAESDVEKPATSEPATTKPNVDEQPRP